MSDTYSTGISAKMEGGLTLDDFKPDDRSVPDCWENRSRDILRNQLGDEAFGVIENIGFKDNEDLSFVSGLGNRFKTTKLGLFSCSTLCMESLDGADAGPLPVGGSGFLKVVSNTKFPDHSFFQAGRMLPIRLRHNNLSFEDDAMLDGRVTCLKMADKDQGGPMDLILHTGRIPQYNTADSFQTFVTAFRQGPNSLRQWCMKSPSNYFGRVENVRKAPASYYTLRYYSHVTYEFTAADGDMWLARFRLIPADGSTETGLLIADEQKNVWDVSRDADVKLAKDYLRSEYIHRLLEAPVQYRLQIQLLKDDASVQVDAEVDTTSSCSTDRYDSISDSFRYSDVTSISGESINDGRLVETGSAITVDGRPEVFDVGPPFYGQYEIRYGDFDDADNRVYVDPKNACAAWPPEVAPWLDFAVLTVATRLDPRVLVRTSFNLGNQLWSCCTLSSKSTRDFRSLALAVRQFHGVAASRRVRADDVIIAQTVYRITVITGTLIHAGTDADISITITGTKGRTPPINLDQRFRDDFESGQRDEFLEEGPEVGEIVVIEMTLSSMLGNRRWYLEEVYVGDVNSKSIARFPCYQWLTSQEPTVTLARGTGMVPHLETLPVCCLQRKYELMVRRARYRWLKQDGLPARIDVSKYEELPRESKFHTEHELNYFATYIRTLANTGSGTLSTLLTTWDIFNDNQKLLTNFLKNKSITRKVIQTWELDEEFGRQILNGPHPVRIRRLSKLPEVFEPARDDIQKTIDRKMTLDEAISAGHFYVLRYPELDDLDCSARYKDKYDRYVTSPICILYVDEADRCLPVAINLDLDGPVWTPFDGPAEWRCAKMWIREADLQIHQVISRHLHTQLVNEAVAIATFRNLPTSHPVYKLLYGHMKYTLAVNLLGRQLLYPAEDGLFQKYLAVGGRHLQLVAAAYRRFDVADLDLVRNLESRGVQDSGLLPGYWYRDDGLAVWRAIEKYVRTVLHLYYRDDQSVRADYELQAWIQDLGQNGLGSPDPEGDDGRRNHGVPEVIESLDDAVRYVTTFVFTASAQHAALSSGMMDYYSYIPNAPSILTLAPPSNKGQVTSSYMKKALPSRGKAAEIIAAYYTLSRRGKYEEYLNSFNEQYFDELPTQQAQQAFIADLERVSSTIQERNKSLEIPYTYLLPENIPKTVSV